MHTAITVRHYIHLIHKGGAKASHVFTHMLHEKSFWGIVVILGVLVAFFAFIILNSENLPAERYNIPLMYGPF